MPLPFFGTNSTVTHAQAEIDAALRSQGVLDVGLLFSETQRTVEASRMSQYQVLRKAYDGRSFRLIMDSGDKEALVNLNKPIVDKSVHWLFGKMPELHYPNGNEAIFDEVMKILEESNIHRRLWNFAHTGAIAGDGYLYLSLSDLEKGFAGGVSLQYLKPVFVHPVFHPLNSDEMIACLVQYPIDVAGSIAAKFNIPAGDTVFSLYFTKDKIRVYNNKSEGGVFDNPFGAIPVFHAPNLMNSFRWFGDSDIADTYSLVDLRNSAINDQKRIIEYFAEPIIVVTGARANNLRKGKGKIWSIKDPQAKVFLLEMNSNLPGITEYIESLKSSILQMANTPEFSLDSEQAISNTSAAALEVKYMALVEKTARKRVTYGYALAKAMQVLAKTILKNNPKILQKLADKENAEKFKIVFPSPLPRDLKNALEIEAAKLQLQLTSQNQSIKAVSQDTDSIPDLMMEILADKREDLMVDVEKSRAVEGGVPNLNATLLGSVGLRTKNVESIMKRQEELAVSLQEKLLQSSVIETNAIQSEGPAPSEPEEV